MYVNGTRVRDKGVEAKEGEQEGKDRGKKSEGKTRFSTIHFPSFPACTILRPLPAASVSVFGTTH